MIQYAVWLIYSQVHTGLLVVLWDLQRAKSTAQLVPFVLTLLPSTSNFYSASDIPNVHLGIIAYRKLDLHSKTKWNCSFLTNSMSPSVHVTSWCTPPPFADLAEVWPVKAPTYRMSAVHTAGTCFLLWSPPFHSADEDCKFLVHKNPVAGL